MSTFNEFYTSASTAGIATTIAPDMAWQLEEIRVHLSGAGGAGDLTATIDHNKGEAYDINLLTQDMTAVVDLDWSPNRPMEFLPGDELDIAWANAAGRTVGIEVIFKGR